MVVFVRLRQAGGRVFGVQDIYTYTRTIHGLPLALGVMTQARGLSEVRWFILVPRLCWEAGCGAYNLVFLWVGEMVEFLERKKDPPTSGSNKKKKH